MSKEFLLLRNSVLSEMSDGFLLVDLNLKEPLLIGMFSRQIIA